MYFWILKFPIYKYDRHSYSSTCSYNSYCISHLFKNTQTSLFYLQSKLESVITRSNDIFLLQTRRPKWEDIIIHIWIFTSSHKYPDVLILLAIEIRKFYNAFHVFLPLSMNSLTKVTRYYTNSILSIFSHWNTSELKVFDLKRDRETIKKEKREIFKREIENYINCLW